MTCATRFSFEDSISRSIFDCLSSKGTSATHDFGLDFIVAYIVPSSSRMKLRVAVMIAGFWYEAEVTE